MSITYAVNSVTIDNFGRKMTQSEVEADRLYGEVALLEWTDSFLGSMNLAPSDPQDFYQEEEEIIFDRAPQPEQEQRLSKHELKAIEKGITQYLSFDCFYFNKPELDAKIHVALGKGMSKKHIPWIMKTSTRLRNMEASRRSRQKKEDEIRELKEKIHFAKLRKEELLKMNHEEELGLEEMYNELYFLRKFYKSKVNQL